MLRSPQEPDRLTGKACAGEYIIENVDRTNRKTAGHRSLPATRQSRAFRTRAHGTRLRRRRDQLTWPTDELVPEICGLTSSGVHFSLDESYKVMIILKEDVEAKIDRKLYLKLQLLENEVLEDSTEPEYLKT
jgi:hypothetical protein